MSNPVMRILKKESDSITFGETATLSGSIKKSIGLIALTIAAAVMAARFFANTDLAVMGMGIGFIGGFILAMVTCFKPVIAEYTAPGYAVFEGMALGIISYQFEQLYFGISAIAVGITFTIMILMLVFWRTGIIKVTDRLRSAIISMTVAVAIFYIINLVVSFFGVNLLPNTGILGIGISFIIAGIASLNLLIDFDNIERSVAQGLPKYMEYFTAFGLLVTLVWLYVEILRLTAMILSMFNDN
ncbi:Bax inhibitor-1/YccA family protein [Pectinatus sottacetonis]|uniref:Bax inhibitor-1/YccA family protein n=1 Tax=Pectinatus sottacetonis TaxID=1002795 RepID=UPI0018C5C4AF|nr:Bax inhibitor-1/YccA family protein [Pectinatus sottacetonis]